MNKPHAHHRGGYLRLLCAMSCSCTTVLHVVIYRQYDLAMHTSARYDQWPCSQHMFLFLSLSACSAPYALRKLQLYAALRVAIYAQCTPGWSAVLVPVWTDPLSKIAHHHVGSAYNMHQGDQPHGREADTGASCHQHQGGAHAAVLLACLLPHAIDVQR